MNGSFDGSGLMPPSRIVTPLYSEPSPKKLELEKNLTTQEDLSYSNDKSNKDQSLLLDFFP